MSQGEGEGEDEDEDEDEGKRDGIAVLHQSDAMLLTVSVAAFIR